MTLLIVSENIFLSIYATRKQYLVYSLHNFIFKKIQKQRMTSMGKIIVGETND
jgi:hypothetical protein